jgi:hypothetical protein
VVSRVDNMGRFFIPGVDAEPTLETNLEFLSAPIDGRFGTKATFSAKLTSGGNGLANQLVIFRLGPVSRQVTTDASGVAEADLALLALPGPYQVQAVFAGTADYMADLASSNFTILKQETQFCFPETDCVLEATVLPNAEDTGIMATLTDVTGRALRERSVFFVVSNDSSSFTAHDITDLFGRAHLGPVPLGGGVYNVSVYFSGERTLKTETGDISVTLDDASYNPSDTAGSLKINSPPVADDQAVVTDENTPVAITLTASDVDGDPLSFVVVDPPISGTLSGDAPNLTYTPNLDFSGTDSFTFKASDAIHESNLATVTITVSSVNEPPVAVDDAYSTDEDTPLSVAAPGVLENDSDGDGDSLTAVLVGDPVSGTLTLNPDGSFSYTPNANFNGADGFSYQASDGITDSNLATVTITVNPVNDPPVAMDDAYATDEDMPLTVPAPGVLENDEDVDGDALTAILVTDPASGTLTLNNDGSFTFEPDPGFYGDDTFSYQASDGTADSNVATVTISVYQVNQPPECSGATSVPGYIWPPDKELWPVTVQDVTDPDADPLTITITAIFQDEPVGSRPDGEGIGTEMAMVRADRDGNGDGRVYHIFFTADDGQGGICEGEVRTAIVSHDQGGDLDAIDGGALYDSTQTE